jgi:branched-chain amino acid transport system substrate-binding protein
MKPLKWTMFLLVITLTFMLSGPAKLIAAEPEILKIGNMGAFSGKYAMWGIPMSRGVELMADKINAEGGIKVGDKTYHIKLVPADTKTTVEGATAQANKLIFNDKVKFIFGPTMSSGALAFQPISEKNKVILMPWCYTPKVLGSDKPFTFRLYPVGGQSASAVFMYLKKHRPDIKTLAMLAPNNETGWGTSKMAKTNAQAMGYKEVEITEEFVNSGVIDFFPVLSKMVSKKPDAIIINSMTPGNTALILQQSRQLGYKGLLGAQSLYDTDMLVEKAGVEAAEGFIFRSLNLLAENATPEMRKFYDSYIQKYKEELSPIAASTYPALFILKMAIEKAGTLDTTAVAKAMEEMEGKHPWGRGRFSMGGVETFGAKHQIVEPVWLVHLKNGKAVNLPVVAPPVP